MGRITELLNLAHRRAREAQSPFAGAMLPHEAYALVQIAPGARLVDVRSHAELELNGVIPGALHVEWRSWPDWTHNPHFLVQLAQASDPESLLFFICRDARRSHHAAAACAESGRGGCYNVLEGFEGELDRNTGHRNEINGWKKRGLPWTQS